MALWSEHYALSIAFVNCDAVLLSKSGCERSSAAIGACKSIQTSIDGPIPFTSEAHFCSHDVLWQGQTKSNEGFPGPMEKGFPLFPNLMALWSEHYALSIALSLATLFAVLSVRS